MQSTRTTKVISQTEKDLEQGFLKAEETAPKPGEPEKVLEGEIEEKTKTKEVTEEYDRLPFDVVHRVLKATCLVALVLWFVIIVFLSIATKSDPFSTLVGLFPVLLTIIITYILVDKYHMESGFLLLFPFILTAILYIMGKGGLLAGLDYQTLSGINIIFGVLFEAVILVHYSVLRRSRKIKKKQVKKEEKKLIIKLDDEEGLKSFVSSIEDKSKAINATIGRVYSVRKGGTEPLRKKIKIDAAHYNEFNELKHEKPGKRKGLAIKLLRKIKERLEVLDSPENEVFDTTDLNNLVKLERNKNGKDKVLEVLIKNDKDPVKAYFEGAMNFCNDALNQLEKEEEKKKK